MRTIKFRAWDKITEQMCEVWEIGFQHWHRTPGLNFVNIQADGKEERLPDEVELMQFTGLLDRNGKEIYEGDMLKDETGETAEIFWDETYCGWRVVGNNTNEPLHNWFNSEVIGNIYENPELIGARQ